MVEKKIIWNVKELKDGIEPFEGLVISAEIEPYEIKSKENGEIVAKGEQLHIQIKPKNIQVSGSTGCFHGYYKIRDNLNSAWGLFLTKMEELGIIVESEKDLVGKEFIWEQKTGVELEGGMVIKKILLPIAKVNGVSKSSEPDTKMFEELVQKLKDDGLTTAQIRKWAYRNKIDQKELDKFLSKLNELKEDEDGIWRLPSE